MKKFGMVGVGVALLLAGTQLSVAADGKAVYEKRCAACHGKGMMGAPKFGDKEKWAELAKVGKDALASSVVGGKGKMPKQNVTPDEAKAAVEYMLGGQ